MLLIDKYAYTNRLKDYSPRCKLIISLTGLILLRIIDRNYLYIANIIFMFFLTVGLAGIPLRNYIRVLKIPMTFLTFSLIMIMISINNTSYIYSLKLGRVSIGLGKNSIWEGFDLFIKVVSSLVSSYFLILTTPITDIIRGLRKVRIPALLIQLMVLIYRSIFIFLREAGNIHLAQSIRFGYRDRKRSIKSLALLISSLFTRIIIKHKEMNIGLECKLYDGEFRLGD